jgi:hypothetical protein
MLEWGPLSSLGLVFQRKSVGKVVLDDLRFI